MNFFMFSPQGFVIDMLTQQASTSPASRCPATWRASCYSFQLLVTEKGSLPGITPDTITATAIYKDYHAIRL
jgi:hypothetical protein